VHSAPTRLRLDADNPASDLPVVSALHATHEVVGGVVHQFRAGKTIAPDFVGPSPAEVAADIEASPVVERKYRRRCLVDGWDWVRNKVAGPCRRSSHTQTARCDEHDTNSTHDKRPHTLYSGTLLIVRHWSLCRLGNTQPEIADAARPPSAQA